MSVVLPIIWRFLSGALPGGALRLTQLRDSLCGSLRHREQYSRHTTQITGCHRQFEVLVNFAPAAKQRLPKAHRISPAEILFDARGWFG